MHLLHALGINQYAFVQFLLFVLIFMFLTGSVFGPYFRALLEREQRTVGGETLAEEYHQRTAELQNEYQTKARSLNAQIAEIFQKNRNEATSEYEVIVSRARTEATSLIEKNRLAISLAIQQATEELRGQTTPMALAITNKLLGK